MAESQDVRSLGCCLVAVVALARPAYADVRHRARLVRELGPTPTIVADDGRLTQVFINLLVNAAHAIA